MPPGERGATGGSEPPLFVVGSSRSGTTLLRLMLTRHPRIAVPPEGEFLLPLRRRFGGFAGERARIAAFATAVLATPKLENWGLAAAELEEFLVGRAPRRYAELAEGVYRLWALRRGKPQARWGDKNNAHVAHIPELADLFPDAVFLHLVRDGRDVACSYRDLVRVRGPHAPRLPTGLVGATRRWRDHVRAADAACARLGPGRAFEIRYEPLVRDPRGTLEELCFFLGLPFDEAMLAPERAAGDEPKSWDAWKWRTREPPSERPAGRFRRDLFPEDVALVELLAADVLRRHGYPLATRWGPRLHPVSRGLEGATCIAARALHPATSLRRAGRRASRRIALETRGRFGPRPRPEKWVFVVGCYNSGTTLLHDVLAAHPDVGSLPREGQDLTDVLPLPRRLGLRRLWALEPQRFHLDEDSTGVDVERLVRQWGAHFDDPRRPVLLEKSPTNAARVRWLDRHFGNAHFVAIVRDGFAVAEGIRRKADHDVGRAAQQWARSNEILLADLERVPRALVVRYEELAADPEPVLARVFAFLGLAGDSAALARRSFTVHGETSAIRDLNARSHAALDAADLDAIEASAGPLLARLGYARPRHSR